MATTISSSPEETLALGESWAAKARPGWVIGLTGDLGAGKTQLVKGFARGMGINQLVTSPTFTLVCEYKADLMLHRLDFYRLANDSEIIMAGLEPYFSPVGVAVIEWYDRWRGPLPTHFRQVTISHAGETERCIAYEDFGD